MHLHLMRLHLRRREVSLIRVLLEFLMVWQDIRRRVRLRRLRVFVLHQNQSLEWMAETH
jgi:hypothetical protein